MSDENSTSQPQPDESAPAETVSEAPDTGTGGQPTTVEPSSEASPQPTQPPVSKPAGSGPISLERIRQLRKSQQKAASPAPSAKRSEARAPGADKGKGPGRSQESGQSEKEDLESAASPAAAVETGVIKTPPPGVAPKVAVPSPRQALSKDLEDELSKALDEANLDQMLVGDSMLQVGHALSEGQRLQGKVMKAQGEFVFLSLGGPNEGLLPAVQFETPPEVGAQIEVVVRGFLAQEGLYELTVPGNAVEVSDWADLNEGEVVEAVVTGSNSGGLECKVGAIRGFIPASQVAEYRVENLAEMVDQKVLCVVTEANPRRGNLVLSRRAVLEREKAEKREERLTTLEVGAAVDGTVTKIMDFGAFVDIGGLDGLLHISQLSWERVNHPSEVVEVGQKIQVRVDKIDRQTGKIGLSYRSLQDHPWTGSEDRFPVGSIVRGSVTRIAEFGAFVRVATGVEGLVHLSELAHHRVHKVSNVVQEGQEVDVKVLSIDTENQRMSLSLKAAQAAPEPANGGPEEKVEEQPPAKPVLPKHRGPLKGGTGGRSGGDQFGLKW